MRVDLRSLSVALGGYLACRSVSVDIADGECIGVVGPNGSGKSTLLRAIYRVLRPAAGSVLLDGDDVWRMSARESARRTAVVLQEGSADFDFTVREVIEMGRTPHKGAFEAFSAEDEAIVEDAASRVGVAELLHRQYVTLSGGEKQRVLIARSLAQGARVLVMDEPTNHLDIRYQLQVLELVRSLGLTVIIALHDVNHAAMYCDRVLVMARGELVGAGPVGTILTGDMIRDVFGVSAEIAMTESGRRTFVFTSLLEAADKPQADGVLQPMNEPTPQTTRANALP